MTFDPSKDVLLVAAVQLKEDAGKCSPVIVDIGIFSMIHCIEARDSRLMAAGGKWFGKIPKVISIKGKRKIHSGRKLNSFDYERDTNFGKLKRIPYRPLQEFMRKWGCI